LNGKKLESKILMLTYGNWTLGIGDPTFLGWFTTVCYFITTIFCIRSYCLQTRLHDQKGKNGAILWLWLGLLYLLLGFNKQLDLQTLLSAIGKSIACSQGWYEHRRLVQALFILILACCLFFITGVLLNIARKLNRPQKISIFGTCLVFVYMLGRAMLFLHISRIFPIITPDNNYFWIVELFGLAIVLFSTKIQITSCKKQE
jgi:hypothetical protein